MAVYKVPQDVEADDKLIGPFSFRQFIYLIVVAICMAASWGLQTIFIPLAIIPLPFILFFAALALPLRKDQPMETYLSAVVSFYFLKSRKRFWQPDGIDSFVTIIPPKDADRILTKQFDEYEATKRLDYLASLVDSHGWSVRGAGVPVPDTSVSSDLYYETQAAPDMMDGGTSEAQSIDRKLQQTTNAFHQNAVAQMHQPVAMAPASQPVNPVAAPAPQLQPQPQPQPRPMAAPQQPMAAAAPLTAPVAPAAPFNPTAQPGPAAQAPITKHLLQQDPLDALTYARMMAEEAEEDKKAAQESAARQVSAVPVANNTAQSTSATADADAKMERAKERAMELAQRDDISVETLAKEANRLEQEDKLNEGDEVTISLR